MPVEVPVKHILVPIDGSSSARKAVLYAGQLSRLCGAAVTLLRVHRPDLYQVNSLAEVPPLGGFQDLSALEKQLNDPALDPVFKEAREALGQVRQVEDKILWGQPAAVICEFARDHHVDQIVMGARGRSNFAALLLGSVSSQVLQYAPCPVTVVR